MITKITPLKSFFTPKLFNLTFLTFFHLENIIVYQSLVHKPILVSNLYQICSHLLFYSTNHLDKPNDINSFKNGVDEAKLIIFQNTAVNKIMCLNMMIWNLWSLMVMEKDDLLFCEKQLH